MVVKAVTGGWSNGGGQGLAVTKRLVGRSRRTEEVQQTDLSPQKCVCGRVGGGGGYGTPFPARQTHVCSQPPPPANMRRAEEGGGSWGPKFCLPEMARSDFPNGKFGLFPR